MQASKLQLDHYYLEGLRFSLNDRWTVEAIREEVPLLPEDVATTVRVGQNPDDELEWFFELGVRLNDVNSKFPYDFDIQLSGFFKVSPDCEPEMQVPIATVNAPSILYGAAREILATVSARSKFVAVFLPPIRFFPLTRKPPEEKALPEGGETKVKREAAKKVAKKK